MVNHYYTNKKEYYINLRSNDATVVQLGSGSSSHKLIFEWNNIFLNQNLSKNAKLGIVQMCQFGADGATSYPYTIRCQQVRNEQFDSSGNTGAVIYFGNMMSPPSFEVLYPITVQNLDTITLIINRGIADKSYGIANTIQFFIQLKVIDYDTEPVSQELMPTYTKNSNALNYPA